MESKLRLKCLARNTQLSNSRTTVNHVATMVITKRLVETEHARWYFASENKGYSLSYLYFWWRHQWTTAYKQLRNGAIRANNPQMLKEFSGTSELTEGSTRSVLKSLNWSKKRAATGKVELSTKLLTEETFTFQKAIGKAILDNKIPPDLVINLD